jgi:hypothetical protein
MTHKCATPAKLKDHVYRCAGIDSVRLQRPIVRKLLPGEDKTDLIHLDALLLLQCLLHRQHLIFRLKVECLLTPGESFDEDLIFREPFVLRRV